MTAGAFFYILGPVTASVFRCTISPADSDMNIVIAGPFMELYIM